MKLRVAPILRTWVPDVLNKPEVEGMLVKELPVIVFPLPSLIVQAVGKVIA